MAKIPLIMNFVSGLLLAYDFYPKTGWLLKFHDGIKKQLIKTDTDNTTSLRTILFNIVISLLIFMCILAWAWYSECGNETSGIGLELILFAIGWFVAWIIITPMAGLLKKMGYENWSLLIGTAIGLTALTYVPRVFESVNIFVSLIAFVYICVLYPFAMIIANNIRKALITDGKRPFHIFAMLGLALFVVSNLIELLADC